MATTPAAALFGFGGMGMPKAPVSSALSQPQTQTDNDIAAPQVVGASYYGDEFAGRPTASGETFDPDLMTAAHRTLPLGSIVNVEDARSGRSVTVRINDRGPFHGDRAIDLSEAAARQIGMVAAGTGKVMLRTVAQA